MESVEGGGNRVALQIPTFCHHGYAGHVGKRKGYWPKSQLHLPLSAARMEKADELLSCYVALVGGHRPSLAEEPHSRRVHR